VTTNPFAAEADWLKPTPRSRDLKAMMPPHKKSAKSLLSLEGDCDAPLAMRPIGQVFTAHPLVAPTIVATHHLRYTASIALPTDWRLAMTTLNPEFLAMLRCPEDRSSLTMADDLQVSRLNAEVAAGQLQNRGGKPVEKQLDGALIRADGKVAYPIIDQIPILLIDEGIWLADVATS
jgi:uncharacterized protein